MRVSNLMEFTENHRYYMCREFALSGLDRKVLTSLYQPMVGAIAIGFYQQLYCELADDAVGCSALDTQRKLFLGLGLELNVAGRKEVVAAASKLEAVGLLQVYRHHNPLTEETLYEYVLLRPLDAVEFFANLHLTLLLRDKLGKVALLELRTSLTLKQPPELAKFVNREEVTVPFYEMFQIAAGSIDPELEAAQVESASTRERGSAFLMQERIRHSDMLLRFPRGSVNRSFVERLNRSPELMGELNYVAYKYNLEVPEICRLLDEDGIFRQDGTLIWDELQSRANLYYRQDLKRDEERERFIARGESRNYSEAENEHSLQTTSMQLDVPERFLAEVTIERYNEMLFKEPYTRMLQRYFPGAVPDAFVRMFERIDLNYKLPEPVTNVLIHYVLGMNKNQRITKSFIDAIASNMLAKGIDTFDKAIRYVKEQEKLNESLERKRRGEEPVINKGSGSSSSYNRGTKRKPSMPVVKDEGPIEEVSAEEEAKMLELARRLKE
ncbi:MAG: DnaD domain protein [Candidatus Cohnella colombiensis]|uniref:DnaD domain protein n=1 Tax=Candidatus Cohnella colombiensis TaxID=3121368 RepID=A0AA95F290_9BACL|nr:MAG: DnaD domain protein [Cohnella sp.]